MCTHCSKYGHSESIYRKKHPVKLATQQEQKGQQTNKDDGVDNQLAEIRSDKRMDKGKTKAVQGHERHTSTTSSSGWVTPMKIGRANPLQDKTQVERLNAYEVLQRGETENLEGTEKEKNVGGQPLPHLGDG